MSETRMKAPPHHPLDARFRGHDTQISHNRKLELHSNHGFENNQETFNFFFIFSRLIVDASFSFCFASRRIRKSS